MSDRTRIEKKLDGLESGVILILIFVTVGLLLNVAHYYSLKNKIDEVSESIHEAPP